MSLTDQPRTTYQLLVINQLQDFVEQLTHDFSTSFFYSLVGFCSVLCSARRFVDWLWKEGKKESMARKQYMRL